MNALLLILEADFSTFCRDSGGIWQILGYVINAFKIIIPIIIVILAILDLGKAVMAGKEDEIKSAQNMLIKRIIYGVAIFFVVTIVQVVFNLVGENQYKEKDKNGNPNPAYNCWICATDPGSTKCYTK